jgi:hypothetical protein
MTEKSNFEKLAAIDVSAHIEKKNGLSYLSWAWAVDQLLRADPLANWRFAKPEPLPDGSMMIFCHVTAFGKEMTMHLPVMDYKNKAIKEPDAFAVNTAMMRCLVKAIALHGLGLYIYAGEDVPNEDQVKAPGVHKPTANPSFQPDEEELKYLNEIVEGVKWLKDDYAAAADLLAGHNLDADEKTWIWDKLDSKVRSGIKKYNQELKEKEGK